MVECEAADGLRCFGFISCLLVIKSDSIFLALHEILLVV